MGCIAGIDIGKTGAISIIHNKKFLDGQEFTSIVDYKNFLSKYDIAKVIIENVHSMPKQGVKSVFSFGERKGEIIALMELECYEYELITPQTWKKKFNLLKTNKNDAIEYAKKIDDNFKEFLTTKNKIYHSGLADSFLIGLSSYF